MGSPKTAVLPFPSSLKGEDQIYIPGSAASFSFDPIDHLHRISSIQASSIHLEIMSVEILGSDVAPGLVKNGIDGESTFPVEVINKVKTSHGQSPEESIQFGLMDSSHGGKEEGKHADSNFLQNATEEWPEPGQIHTFYFVKVRSYEDPKLKAKIEQAEKEVQKKNKARFQITEALKAKRSERAQVISQLKPLTSEDKRYRSIMDEKRKEMEPLQDALGKLRGSNNVNREKGMSLCSSEEELNYLIQSFQYRIQHESNTLSEEKQLLKEIKQLEGTREKVIANAAVKAKIQDSLGQKEAIQDQVKLIGVDMGGVRKEKQVVRTKIKQLEDELKVIDAEITSLQEQLEPLTAKRDMAFEDLSKLIKTRQELNTCYHENRSLLNIAKDLAAKKDIQALKELCHSEVENFMSQWSSNKVFRDDYERRIWSSLDNRQLTKDGRQRNPDEKPIIVEPSLPPPPVVDQEAPIKVSGKREKEDANLSNGAISSRKIKVDHHKPTEESGEKASVPQEKEYASGVEKSQEKPVEIDAVKLKEMKREEELAKANLARERKKKQAEKAAARATARAQKEAEKKLKEKEKKAKKKGVVSATDPSSEQTESEEKIEELEETDVNVDTPVPTKNKELKDKTKYRNQPKMQDQLPRRIPKRKKSHSYLVWAAPAAIAAILALVVAMLISISFLFPSIPSIGFSGSSSIPPSLIRLEIMGVEISGADVTPGPVKDGMDGENIFHPVVDNKAKTVLGQRAEEPIQFGMMDSSQGANGGKKEVKQITNATFPHNATEEWPAPEQIHTFYFVKVRSYEDPKLKVKIEQADKEVQKKNKARFQMTEALKAKRSERAQVISQLKPLTSEDKRYRSIMDEKRKEMEPLQDALGKLRGSNNVTREKGMSLCSSEEELNYLIQSLQYRIQHESNTLSEEKQLLKEIKQLEGTREKVIANAAVKAKIQDSLGQKEAIQDQVKLIGVDMGGVRKEKQAVRTKIKQLEDELKAIDAEITSLQEQLEPLSDKRDKAFENFSELIKARQELNTCSRENRSLLNVAKDLAARKDIQALEELCHSEVEKFMSQWSSNKAFRDDYEKRILSSLDSRQLTKDGRQRNPDEKPIIQEASPPPLPVEQEVPIKVGGKREKEDSSLNNGIISSRKIKDEDHHKSTEKNEEKVSAPQEEEYLLDTEKSQEKPVAIDAVKLKEMQREEELAKANLARERKKKLAEKAAVKALLRAEKEAEKKLREKEKRAKKKAGVSAPDPSDEQTEPEEKIEEAEEADVNVDAPVRTRSKELKVKSRYKNQPKTQEQLPKRILKRKKSHSYFVWAAPAAILALVLAVLVYIYKNN
ncbi:hypothetical protein J5N97_004787 [Dioscorea zingiberensis]|uniref:Proton pump-interactor 1 n=1 Tax=Dioscorea zingiberensis TaxID=325984 RepID=A0A9D5HS60_9LILI|nr:hypothetical protein J5N97_004787 [Dioscorea zingiberensis]